MSQPPSFFDPSLGRPLGTPTIELGVSGPRRQEGFVLRIPPKEELVWDLENEIASSRRHRLDDGAGWWVAGSYLNTVVDIVLRSHASVLLLDRAGEDRLLSRDGTRAVQERLV